jgi:DNA-binding XRE family transcriptional regulator|tara:strand:+ start:2759 stop:3196 length:438 start_codon:yes stop_codon:yes gene_type:complete
MGKSNVSTDVFKSVAMAGPDDCWPWKGKINAKDQRPYITVSGIRRAAYVIVYELYTGEQADGRYALHSCDNSVCCNPYHLSWGSHQDNMDDMRNRDRHGLPKTVIRSIRKLLDNKKTHQHIAELYGVSRETITAINNGRGKQVDN